MDGKIMNTKCIFSTMLTISTKKLLHSFCKENDITKHKFVEKAILNELKKANVISLNSELEVK